MSEPQLIALFSLKLRNIKELHELGLSTTHLSSEGGEVELCLRALELDSKETQLWGKLQRCHFGELQ